MVDFIESPGGNIKWDNEPPQSHRDTEKDTEENPKCATGG